MHAARALRPAGRPDQRHEQCCLDSRDTAAVPTSSSGLPIQLKVRFCGVRCCASTTAPSTAAGAGSAAAAGCCSPSWAGCCGSSCCAASATAGGSAAGAGSASAGGASGAATSAMAVAVGLPAQVNGWKREARRGVSPSACRSARKHHGQARMRAAGECSSRVVSLRPARSRSAPAAHTRLAATHTRC